MTDSTDELLAQRQKTHGDFTINARISQSIRRAMQATGSGWWKLSDVQCEVLEMVAHKIGRILAGDHDYKDHWDDLAGYARLASERCRRPTVEKSTVAIKAPLSKRLQMQDGMLAEYYQKRRLPFIDIGIQSCLLDRRHVRIASWDHLPRFAFEQNHKEWKELPSQYAALYYLNGDKYEMHEKYREHWGRQ